MTNSIEELYFDKNKKSVTSLPVIKSGPNRGWHLSEKNGKWIYISGYALFYPEVQSLIHHTWAKKLISLGFRVGKHIYEDCVSFYLFKENSK